MIEKEEELIGTLTYFDLKYAEAKVYLELQRVGEIPVESIYAKINLEPTEIFRALNKLANLGLIQGIRSNPMRWKVVDPEKGLCNVIENKKEEIIIMEKMLKQLVEDLKRLASDS